MTFERYRLPADASRRATSGGKFMTIALILTWFAIDVVFVFALMHAASEADHREEIREEMDKRKDRE